MGCGVGGGEGVHRVDAVERDVHLRRRAETGGRQAETGGRQAETDRRQAETGGRQAETSGRQAGDMGRGGVPS